MGAILSLPFKILNLLLPFTRAGTPLSQDVLHAIVLCGTLYYAPQINAWYTAQQQAADKQNLEPAEGEEDTTATQAPHQTQGPEPRHAAEDLPLDERLVLQDDGEGDPDPGRPPRAPTPPPREEHVHQHDPADAFAPGPANPPPNPSRNNRVVGTKKAKAIRRRNEERQYNEWVREQAQVRRLQDEEGREEREAALAIERERRAAAEEVIRQKEREEREALKREREREAEEEAARRERVVAYVRDRMAERGCVNLVEAAYTEGKDRTWVDALSALLVCCNSYSKRAVTSCSQDKTGWSASTRRSWQELMLRPSCSAKAMAEKLDSKTLEACWRRQCLQDQRHEMTCTR